MPIIQRGFVLVRKADRSPIEVGDVITDFRGETDRLISADYIGGGSTGRVYGAKYSTGYYPSVFGLVWVLAGVGEVDSERSARMHDMQTLDTARD